MFHPGLRPEWGIDPLVFLQVTIVDLVLFSLRQVMATAGPVVDPRREMATGFHPVLVPVSSVGRFSPEIDPDYFPASDFVPSQADSVIATVAAASPVAAAVRLAVVVDLVVKTAADPVPASFSSALYPVCCPSAVCLGRVMVKAKAVVVVFS